MNLVGSSFAPQGVASLNHLALWEWLCCWWALGEALPGMHWEHCRCPLPTPLNQPMLPPLYLVENRPNISSPSGPDSRAGIPPGRCGWPQSWQSHDADGQHDNCSLSCRAVHRRKGKVDLPPSPTPFSSSSSSFMPLLLQPVSFLQVCGRALR